MPAEHKNRWFACQYASQYKQLGCDAFHAACAPLMAAWSCLLTCKALPDRLLHLILVESVTQQIDLAVCHSVAAVCVLRC